MQYSLFVYSIKEYIFVPKFKKNMDKSIHSHLYHQVIGRLRGKREKWGLHKFNLLNY